MLTITIPKSELKKAYFGGSADYTQELTADAEPQLDWDKILLKIMIENENSEEAA